jgi:excisionase family DNA binding protein
MQDLEKFETHNLNPDPLLSVKEAADYLNISKSKMYLIVKKKELPTVQIDSNDKKIRQSVLDRLIRQSEQPRCWATATSTSKEKSK